jgi:short-subunit dehydrogenase
MKTPSSAAPVALVTGASGGIGYEISHELARRGYPVVVVARSAGKLRTLSKELQTRYQTPATVMACDLAAPGAAVKLMAQLSRQKLVVDVLVNNAGIGSSGDFAEVAWETQNSMLQLNIVALTQLTHLLLPQMLQRKTGRILNVGSTGAFSPVPGMAVYGATKAFVLSFSEALAAELQGSGVTVTALCPGATHTGFAAHAQVQNSLIFKFAMPAKTVARLGVQALLQGKKIIMPGWLNRLMVFSIRLSPRAAVLAVSRLLMKGEKSG